MEYVQFLEKQAEIAEPIMEEVTEEQLGQITGGSGVVLGLCTSRSIRPFKMRKTTLDNVLKRCTIPNVCIPASATFLLPSLKPLIIREPDVGFGIDLILGVHSNSLPHSLVLFLCCIRSRAGPSVTRETGSPTG